MLDSIIKETTVVKELERYVISNNNNESIILEVSYSKIYGKRISVLPADYQHRDNGSRFRFHSSDPERVGRIAKLLIRAWKLASVIQPEGETK